MSLINQIFRPLLDTYVIAYMDDILVYSKTREEHLQQLCQVLCILRDHKLYAKVSKCEFLKCQISFLGYVISDKEVETDPKKIEEILSWPIPTSIRQLQSFLGLAGYYRRFVHDFSKKAAPLTDLTKQNIEFLWSEKAQQSFDTLKAALSSAPVLRPADPSLPFWLMTDASGDAIGAVLCQDDGDGLRPVAFESRKLTPAEKNYPFMSKKCWQSFML